MEEWRRMIYQGEDYGEYYSVSNKGRIRSEKTGKIRKQCIGSTGYYIVCVTLGSRSKKKTIRVHRAVAESFIQNPENKPVINHIDGNRANNNLNNLEWCTHKENTIHAVKHDLIKSGEESHKSKLSNEDVLFIRNLYDNDRENYNTTNLAKKFGVKPEAIRIAAIRKSFRNI